MKEKFDRIREICGGWGLYEEGNSTEQAQLLKALSEVGELADSILKNDREQAKDDIGDILVCLVNSHELSEPFIAEYFEYLDMFDYRGQWIYPNNEYAIGDLSREIANGLMTEEWDRESCLGACTSIANHFNLTIGECLDQAISVIEKRKGRIINGAFVKDTN